MFPLRLSMRLNDKKLLNRLISSNIDRTIIISEEVLNALNNNIPIVALESTIISHGMPWPRNLDVAKEAENIVRENGACPATIAVINGICKIGLNDNELKRLAAASLSNDNKTEILHVAKASRRDLAHVCANRGWAATTVASTMLLAQRAGIRVFATGGLGGVHRGAEETFDISADLIELGRTKVVVVCGGVKSILDIPKTLEVLETQGVPVLSWKQKNFPAFFTADSGLVSPLRVDSSHQVAQMMYSADVLGLNHGMVVAVPNPDPADGAVIDHAIRLALKDAEANNIRGASITPFLLAQIEKATGGSSLEANIKLVMNNVKIATDIAKEFSVISCKSPTSVSSEDIKFHSKTDFNIEMNSQKQDIVNILSKTIHTSSAKPVVVFGGSVVDYTGMCSTSVPTIVGSSNPGTIRNGFGGVGRNVAEAICRLGGDATLVSAVGDDEQGRSLISHATNAGVDTNRILKVIDLHTPSYLAVHDHESNLVVGIADMEAIGRLDVDQINVNAGAIKRAQVVVTDANLPQESLVRIAKLCTSYNVPLVFEPTSNHKCALPVQHGFLNDISLIKPNFGEIQAILRAKLFECENDGSTFEGKANVEHILRDLETSLITDTRLGGIEAHLSLTQDDTVQSTLALVLARLLRRGSAYWRMRKSNPEQQLESSHTLNGAVRPIIGEHVVLSLGNQGIKWAGPVDILGGEAACDMVSDDGVGIRHFSCPSLLSDTESGEVEAAGEDNIIDNTSSAISSSGAGDTLCGAIVQGLIMGKAVPDVAHYALQAAALSVASDQPVPVNLSQLRKLKN